MPRGLGVKSLLRTLVLFSGAMASVDAGLPELALLLGLCNSIEVLLNYLRRSGGLWRMRVFGKGEGGVGSIFICIITSLASGDVTVMPRLMVVVWGGDVVTSFVGSMGP